MSNENTTTLTDTSSRLRFTVRADGSMMMRIAGETGNEYELDRKSVV